MLVNGTTLRGAETLKRSLIDTPSQLSGTVVTFFDSSTAHKTRDLVTCLSDPQSPIRVIS